MSIEDNEIIAAEEVVAETPVETEAVIVEEPVVEEPTVEESVIEEPKATEPTVEPFAEKSIPESFKKKKNTEPVKETVAIYSSKNVFWKGVGEIKRGYNIVSKEHSELWLKRMHVRLATPHDIARELNN